jgi:hypothetical protein
MKNYFLILFMYMVFGCNAPVVAEPKIEVPDNEHNFGVLLPGQVIHHSFVIKNVGTEDLIITDVSPGCGCTTALLLDKIIPPGKSVTLEADLTAQATDGVMRKNINISSNDRKNSTFIIYLNATVKNDFLITPRKFEIGDMYIGEKKEFKFKLKPINNKPFEPSQIIYTPQIFKVEYKALDPKDPLSEVEFTVEYFAAAIFKARNAFDMIKIYPYKDNKTFYVEVQFTGKIMGYIKLSNPSIFRYVEKGKGHTEVVNCKHIKDAPFVINAAVSSNANITTNIIKKSESDYDIELALKEDYSGKRENTMVTVTTDQEDSKELKIYMTILPKK